ncbi:MAG: acetyl-CoA C-acyltransferase [Anaerolineae bacterium CG_4_9_14_3_um_filter_57_17]|nr:acetyl-CoA C-acetyltransferase [bacterium]NCT21714.1 acetyl-CoA C-acetyltransferase [bacterium]OIO84546.1 MAG: acetyl-CoA acetyltransferase [Anaerolineae bacterium CG2_30_57_67]PJB65533.1 MAG: acetyl-CoA C-acyltransferase [Anaerolineae bacterium CG_4_9_14_3_um_filter_57_17]
MSKELEPVILSAARTPIAKFQGALSALSAPSLGAVAIKAAVQRANLPDPAEIDEVLMGNVIQAGLGQAPARQASIFAGLPASVGATTFNKVCGSGMKAAMFAAQAIRAGDGSLFVAGGMESMTRAPFLVPGRTGELRYGHVEMKDSLVLDGLWDPFEDWGMGNAADFIADEFEVTREAMDKFSLSSHQKAIAAIDSGAFRAEIAPVEVPGRKGAVTIFDTDEGPRRDASLEALAKLKPAFNPQGKVTAGNSSTLNDGAAALVIASQAYAESRGLAPLARIAGYAQAAVEPKYLFGAPAFAIPRALQKAGWKLTDVDLFEVNEAFAAQALANGYALRAQGWDWTKVNVNGGGISLGHPLGASGARIVTTLLYALKARGLKRGMASLCLGGGEAVAMAVELL